MMNEDIFSSFIDIVCAYIVDAEAKSLCFSGEDVAKRRVNLEKSKNERENLHNKQRIGTNKGSSLRFWCGKNANLPTCLHKIAQNPFI